MKFSTKATLAVLFISIFFISCKKVDSSITSDTEVSPVALQQIAAHGFSTGGVQKFDNGYLKGYLVEGDIVITDKDLNQLPTIKSDIIIANEEHYRVPSQFLVTGNPRIITVSLLGGGNSIFIAALDIALNRYNALNLKLKFIRVNGLADITFTPFFDKNVGFSVTKGLFEGGNPIPIVFINMFWINTNTEKNFLATIMAHEIGHTIGFRHTDCIHEAWSCGGVSPAIDLTTCIWIPGTPMGSESKSWMKACGPINEDLPFTPNDIIALKTVY